jgi:hypothetical protein
MMNIILLIIAITVRLPTLLISISSCLLSLSCWTEIHYPLGFLWYTATGNPSICTLNHTENVLFLSISSDLYADKKTVDSLPSIKEVVKWVCGPALGIALGVFFQHEVSKSYV